MLEWLKSHINDDNRFGWIVTLALHLLLLLLAFLYHIQSGYTGRPSWIEVTLGEYQTGTQAQYAEQRQEEVQTRPDPAEVQPEEPDPEVLEPEEIPEQRSEETATPVDLPEQPEEIVDPETVETPVTDRIDPTVVPEQRQEEVESPPRTQQDDQIVEGAEESGDERGVRGDLNVDQGTGRDLQRSSPYDLRWEGDLDRTPMVQPLPENTQDVEAVITVRFEVFPNGAIGRIIPLIKMNPELEREVMSTLRNWRFSRLPSGVPQEPQWGTITFRFVMN